MKLLTKLLLISTIVFGTACFMTGLIIDVAILPIYFLTGRSLGLSFITFDLFADIIEKIQEYG